MLHWWLIPALVIFMLALAVFYFVVRTTGGSSTRTEGRALLDNPEDEPPSLEDRKID